MIGYSEVFNTIGAMVIFSFILMNANRLILRNTVYQVNAELEQEVVALSQDIIEESKTKEFDANTTDPLPPADIPGGFTNAGGLGPSSSESGDRAAFNDFDDYNGWSEVITTEHGDFNISCEVFYVDEPGFGKVTYKTTYKKIVVTVNNKYLKTNAGKDLQDYRFEFIRNYYAD